MNPATKHRFDLRIVLLLWPLLFAGCAVAPPVQEMSDARQAIRAAREAHADRLAPQALSNAERFLDKATNRLGDGAYLEARQAALSAKDEAVRARDIAIKSERGQGM
jgi:hypothetical protein